MKPSVIYLSTSNLENAIEILLNCGAFTRLADAEAQAEKRFETVFRISIEPQ